MPERCRTPHELAVARPISACFQSIKPKPLSPLGDVAAVHVKTRHPSGLRFSRAFRGPPEFRDTILNRLEIYRQAEARSWR